jgi:hypothetical protein
MGHTPRLRRATCAPKLCLSSKPPNDIEKTSPAASGNERRWPNCQRPERPPPGSVGQQQEQPDSVDPPSDLQTIPTSSPRHLLSKPAVRSTLQLPRLYRSSPPTVSGGLPRCRPVRIVRAILSQNERPIICPAPYPSSHGYRYSAAQEDDEKFETRFATIQYAYASTAATNDAGNRTSLIRADDPRPPEFHEGQEPTVVLAQHAINLGPANKRGKGLLREGIYQRVRRYKRGT